MNIIPDLMYDREVLRYQLKKWKWLFFIVLILLIIIINKNTTKTGNDFIARINLEGIIDHDPDLIKTLEEIEKNSKIKAVIIHINSPGGTTFAGEELYVTLKKLSKIKPTISVLETVAASGGYMVALATDRIIARNLTITGSIGVLWQSFEAVEMANKLGIKFISLKSSPLKASPNPMEEATPAAKEAAMEVIQDSYTVFLNMLIQSRKIPKEQALKLANGKIFIGQRAKELNLIDEIGGEDEALKWLESEKKISSNLSVEDIDWSKPKSIFEELTKFLHNGNHILIQLLNNNYSVMAK